MATIVVVHERSRPSPPECIMTTQPGAKPPSDLDCWIARSFSRLEQLPESERPNRRLGHCYFAYNIIGDHKPIHDHRKVRNSLDAVSVRYPLPARSLLPAPGGTKLPWRDGVRDWHSNSFFWRFNEAGEAFLLEHFREDSGESDAWGRAMESETAFDMVAPIRRVGALLLHARSVSDLLFNGSTNINLVGNYSGLSGRRLDHYFTKRDKLVPVNQYRATKTSVSLEISVQDRDLEWDIQFPDSVGWFIEGLYSLFGYDQVPLQLITDEVWPLYNRLMKS